MRMLEFVLTWSLPILILLAIAEGFYYRYKKIEGYAWKENYASGILGVVFLISELLAASLGQGLISDLWKFRLFTIPLDTWWGLLLLFFVVDFVYYWQHRCCHGIRWFWASHNVHHTPQHYNLSMGYRVSWSQKITGVFLFYTPLVFLGFHPVGVFLMLGLNLHYQFWLHCGLIPKLGWFEIFFNTPSHHKIHHACNNCYLNRNYGGVLMIFDKLFGTYSQDIINEPCRYGLTTGFNSSNPFLISTHEWLAIFNDVKNESTWNGRIKQIFGSPR